MLSRMQSLSAQSQYFFNRDYRYNVIKKYVDFVENKKIGNKKTANDLIQKIKHKPSEALLIELSEILFRINHDEHSTDYIEDVFHEMIGCLNPELDMNFISTNRGWYHFKAMVTYYADVYLSSGDLKFSQVKLNSTYVIDNLIYALAQLMHPEVHGQFHNWLLKKNIHLTNVKVRDLTNRIYGLLLLFREDTKGALKTCSVLEIIKSCLVQATQNQPEIFDTTFCIAYMKMWHFSLKIVNAYNHQDIELLKITEALYLSLQAFQPIASDVKHPIQRTNIKNHYSKKYIEFFQNDPIGFLFPLKENPHSRAMFVDVIESTKDDVLNRPSRLEAIADKLYSFKTNLYAPKKQDPLSYQQLWSRIKNIQFSRASNLVQSLKNKHELIYNSLARKNPNARDFISSLHEEMTNVFEGYMSVEKFNVEIVLNRLNNRKITLLDYNIKFSNQNHCGFIAFIPFDNTHWKIVISDEIESTKTYMAYETSDTNHDLFAWILNKINRDEFYSEETGVSDFLEKNSTNTVEYLGAEFNLNVLGDDCVAHNLSKIYFAIMQLFILSYLPDPRSQINIFQRIGGSAKVADKLLRDNTKAQDARYPIFPLLSDRVITLFSSALIIKSEWDAEFNLREYLYLSQLISGFAVIDSNQKKLTLSSKKTTRTDLLAFLDPISNIERLETMVPNQVFHTPYVCEKIQKYASIFEIKTFFQKSFTEDAMLQFSDDNTKKSYQFFSALSSIFIFPNLRHRLALFFVALGHSKFSVAHTLNRLSHLPGFNLSVHWLLMVYQHLDGTRKWSEKTNIGLAEILFLPVAYLHLKTLGFQLEDVITGFPYTIGHAQAVANGLSLSESQSLSLGEQLMYRLGIKLPKNFTQTACLDALRMDPKYYACILIIEQLIQYGYFAFACYTVRYPKCGKFDENKFAESLAQYDNNVSPELFLKILLHTIFSLGSDYAESSPDQIFIAVFCMIYLIDDSDFYFEIEPDPMMLYLAVVHGYKFSYLRTLTDYQKISLFSGWTSDDVKSNKFGFNHDRAIYDFGMPAEKLVNLDEAEVAREIDIFLNLANPPTVAHPKLIGNTQNESLVSNPQRMMNSTRFFFVSQKEQKKKKKEAERALMVIGDYI